MKDRYVVLRECVIGAGSSAFDGGCRCDHHATFRSCGVATPPDSPADGRRSNVPSSSGPGSSLGPGQAPEIGMTSLPGLAGAGLEMLRAQLEIYESEKVYNARQMRAVGKDKKGGGVSGSGGNEKDSKDKKEHVNDLLELLFVKRSAYVKAKLAVTCYFARETIILGAHTVHSSYSYEYTRIYSI